MTYLQTGQATTDFEFRLRVKAAMFKIAQDVANEDDQVEGHPNRAALADAIIRDPDSQANQFVWLCASNPTIASKVTVSADGEIEVKCEDGEIEYVIASYWGSVSGWQTAKIGGSLAALRN